MFIEGENADGWERKGKGKKAHDKNETVNSEKSAHQMNGGIRA